MDQANLLSEVTIMYNRRVDDAIEKLEQNRTPRDYDHAFDRGECKECMVVGPNGLYKDKSVARRLGFLAD